MATKTSFLKLTKPDGGDNVDVSVLNDNADKLDLFASQNNLTVNPAVGDETPTLDSLQIGSAIFKLGGTSSKEVVPISWEEYNKLPEELKNSGIKYYIPDYPVDGIPGEFILVSPQYEVQSDDLQEQLNAMFGTPLYVNPFIVETVSTGGTNASIRVRNDGLGIDDVIKYNQSNFPTYSAFRVEYGDLHWKVITIKRCNYNGVDIAPNTIIQTWQYDATISFEFFDGSSSFPDGLFARNDINKVRLYGSGEFEDCLSVGAAFEKMPNNLTSYNIRYRHGDMYGGSIYLNCPALDIVDEVVNIGHHEFDDFILDYNIHFGYQWELTAKRECTFNGTTFKSGDIVTHWSYSDSTTNFDIAFGHISLYAPNVGSLKFKKIAEVPDIPDSIFELVWYNRHDLDDDILGKPRFYHASSTQGNPDTYLTDGFIKLADRSGSNCEGNMISSKTLPRGVYSKVVIEYIQRNFAAADWRMKMGFTTNKTSGWNYTSDGAINGTYFPNEQSQDLKTITVDLTAYNAHTEDLYFYICGNGNNDIYSITFI